MLRRIVWFATASTLITLVHETAHATHYASRSLIFGFPDPGTAGDKKPLPFDKDKPFQHLGLQRAGGTANVRPTVDDVELTLNEYTGTDGVQQISKRGAFL